MTGWGSSPRFAKCSKARISLHLQEGSEIENRHLKAVRRKNHAIGYSNYSPLKEEAMGRTYHQRPSSAPAALQRCHEIDETACGHAGIRWLRIPGESYSRHRALRDSLHRRLCDSADLHSWRDLA